LTFKSEVKNYGHRVAALACDSQEGVGRPEDVFNESKHMLSHSQITLGAKRSWCSMAGCPARQCAPWRELLGLPPYSLPPWPPWSSAGVDGVAKLLPHTYTNRIRSRLARCAKLNLTAAIRTRGARTIVFLEEVNNILYVYYLIYRYFIKTTSRCKAWR
jgi:hypothetical protein